MYSTTVQVYGRNHLPPVPKIVSGQNQAMLGTFAKPSLKPMDLVKPGELWKQRNQVAPYRISLKPKTDNYDLEYLKINDTANLHQLPWLEDLKHHVRTDNYDMFGVCHACFHMRGPHFHYLVPVRTGGGYTLYHKMAFKAIGVGGKINWNTVKWLNQQKGHKKFQFDPDVRDMTVGNKYSVELFHEFVENGGDTLALQEYLESNFDENVLQDLKDAGVDTKLIADYASLLRKHVKEKINSNMNKQESFIQKQSTEILLVTCFMEIEEWGTDLDMLHLLLTHGEKSSEIMEYVKKGGNIELLEHSVEFLFNKMKTHLISNTKKYSTGTGDSIEDTIIRELQRYIVHETKHRNAEIFVKFMSKGGRLNVLKEYAINKAVKNHSLTPTEIELMTNVMEMFPSRSKLVREIERFVNHQLKIYTSADLLQKYLQKGGDISALKDYVRLGCSFSPPTVQEHLHAGGNLRMIQDIGKQFYSDEEMGTILERFPNDPEIIEVYSRRGGDIKVLLKAMTSIKGKAGLEDYVRRGVFKVISNDIRNQNQVEGLKITTELNVVTPIDGRSNFKGFRKMAVDDKKGIYPRIIALAQAEFLYDKHRFMSDFMTTREGDLLAAAVASNRDALSFSSGSKNLMPLLMKQRGITIPSVSMTTGKKRERLWKAPPPFVVKRSNAEPTKATSPFSHDRQYNLKALTEDNILEIEKKERTNLDFIKRTINPKPVRKSFPKLPLIKSEKEEPKPPKPSPEDVEEKTVTVEKKSNRRKQREKLKKMKQERAIRSNGTISSGSLADSFVKNTVDISPTPTPHSIATTTPPMSRPIVIPDVGKSRESSSNFENVKMSRNPSRESSHLSLNSGRSSSLHIVAHSIPSTPLHDTSKPHDDLRPKILTRFDSDDESEMILSKSRKTKMQMQFHPIKARSTPIIKEEDQPVTLPQNISRTRVRKPRKRRKVPVVFDQNTDDSISSRPSTRSSQSTDDLLRRYCIIRRDRMSAYKSIFNKYIEVQNMSKEEDFLPRIKYESTKLRRRESSFYNDLYPPGDPVLERDRVEDALHELFGSRVTVDQDIIFETLLHLPNAEHVNFHTFCVLAAIGETSAQHKKLPQTSTHTKNAGDLDEKVNKCKNFYNTMLGSNGDILAADIKLGGFTDSQCNMAKSKLTGEDNTLSFLDFVTYIPLFVHIHENVVNNPMMT